MNEIMTEIIFFFKKIFSFFKHRDSYNSHDPMLDDSQHDSQHEIIFDTEKSDMCHPEISI
jgi:hypothetical protein